MMDILAVLLSVGSGTIGGAFFAFSTFVMKALGDLPTAHGVSAMQRINVVVLNPWFLGVFIGTAGIGTACVVLAFLPWASPRSPLLVAAGLLYVLGCFGVTMMFNVPRNDSLARLSADSAEAQAYWQVYLREWLFWNHVRTAASAAAAACSAAALAS
jgi:uncharacterized membrane protein